MNARMWKLFIAGWMLAGLAGAQDEDPGRGVARLSLINGDVSVRRGDSGDMVAAALNAPLVVEDALITGAGSRAELQFDWANMIRLSGDTEVRLAQLDTNRYLLEVARGLVTFRVEHNSDADVEISTPSVSVRPSQVGSYRILVRDDGESEITVRSGAADIFTPQGSEQLGPGRTMLARGAASGPEFQTVAEIAHDDWDRWNEDRDRYYGQTDAYRYVDHSVYGAEDLGNYGSWVDVPPYGDVWSPRVDAGWAPYYNGSWGWEDYYGWTWMSYDPWGWAPFHYGRWFWGSGYGWCWYPGGLRSRQYWSPGLVAFVGWGGGGVGLGFGRVGWIPLAPHEAYYPWYGRGLYRGYRNGGYIGDSVHIVNNTNIYNAYRNARAANGITGMEASQFGRFGGGHFRVGENQLRDVSLVRGQLPMVPDRSSLRFSNRQAVMAPAVRAPANQRFVTRRPASQVERVPFEQQQRSMERAARRTFGEPAAVRSGTAAGGARAGGFQAPAARAEVQPRGQGNAVTLPSPAENGNAGWRRFGGPSGAGSVRSSDQPAARPGANPGMRSAPAPSAAAPRSADRAPQMRTEPPQAAPRSEPLRISPPIVRERQAAPRMEAPRMQSAPSGGSMRAPSGGGGGRSAPSHGGGGGRGGGGGHGRR